LLALLSLQQQLVVDNAREADFDEAFNSRLSRVVSKLFARVIKAEEAMAEPFSSGSLDIEAIVCGAEDFLTAVHNSPLQPGSMESCNGMIRNLLTAIMQELGSGPIRDIMESVGIDSHSSLALMLSSLEGGQSTEPDSFDLRPLPTEPAFSAQPTPGRGSSWNAATLVSAVANAPPGVEREAALDALRQYKAVNGDEDLVAHLNQLSSAFRAFIEEQIADSSTENGAGTIMSARLQSLRSRLEATEAGVEERNQIEATASEEQYQQAASVLSVVEQQYEQTYSQTYSEDSRGEQEFQETEEVLQTEEVFYDSHSFDDTPQKAPVVEEPEPEPVPVRVYQPQVQITIPVETKPSPPSSKLAAPTPSKRTSRLSQPSSVSRLSKPSPSRLAPPSSSKLPGNSAQTLRERLAASQETRPATSPVSSSMSRAALLRARLEAVKQKHKQPGEE
jgi:hypothetical protein